MQVQPNSTIYLLEDVPIDKSYNYSLHFERIQDQTAYFQSKVIRVGTTSMIFNPHQYQRANANSLKVAVLADDVITCNYIMFKNNGTLNGNMRYANKWFYAFATVRYLNENACTIEYEIDDIQTWMFDYEFNECFIEREHSITDVAGDNLQPEPVDTGELVVTNAQESDFTPYMFGAIITTKQLEDSNGEITITYGPPAYPVNVVYTLSATFMPTRATMDGSEYDNKSGIPCGLYIYTGLLCDKEDWTNYFSSHYSLFNMANPVSSTYSDRLLTCGRLLDAITNSYISGLTLSENDIVACYIYPAGFNLKSAETTAETIGFKKGIAVYESEIAVSNPFGSTYTPINNKLKTAPFAKVFVTTETGGTGEYRFEYFAKNNQGNPVVKWNKISTYFGQPTASFVPYNYKGKVRDYDDSIITSPYPVPIYKGNAFQTWWQQSKNSFILGTIANALNLGLTSALSFGRGNIGIGSHALTAMGGTALSSIGTLADKSNVPSNAYYQAQNEALSIGTNRTKFIVYFLCVTPEYARKIDSFFTKYGYATNELKIPNLQRGEPKRHYWNYLKVKNCMLHGLIPSDVEDHLERIYENGITMWTVYNNQVDVGDYSKTNDIVIPT